ncbi:MAG: SRPBCC family protein, partial [Pseudonocardia sediminis]
MTGVTVVDAGARRVARRAEVRASASEIFDLLADPHRHGELDGSGTVRATVSGPSRLDMGASFSVNMKQLGVPYRITSRVVAFEQDRLIEWRHPLGHTWRWRLEPIEPAGTAVTETFDYSATRAA